MQRTMHFPLKAYGREAFAGEMLCGAYLLCTRNACLSGCVGGLPRQWQPARLPPRAQFSCRSLSIFLAGSGARSHFVLSISYPACNRLAPPPLPLPSPSLSSCRNGYEPATSKLHNSGRYHERKRAIGNASSRAHREENLVVSLPRLFHQGIFDFTSDLYLSIGGFLRQLPAAVHGVALRPRGEICLGWCVSGVLSFVPRSRLDCELTELWGISNPLVSSYFKYLLNI